jgi:3-hydroxyisobutyrate dehydrogenase-like beta-hydroxyacid dehydrogenase
MTTDEKAPPMRVGFLGLGRMGRAMAGRLLDAGIEVVVWNRSPGPVAEMVELGAIPAADPGEALATGHVFSMLANEAVVREVFSAEALAAAPTGLVHVNHATISPRAAKALEELHRAHGHVYVAAPVVGRPDVADRAHLTRGPGGDSAAIERSTAALDAIGKRVWDHGSDAANANVAKVAINYLIIHALQALSESVTLVERHGLDAATFIDAINDSIFPGAVYDGYGHGIVARRYQPAGFTTTLGLKDLLLAIGTAEASGVALPTGDVLREVFEAAMEEGHADDDWSSIAEVTRERSAGGER